jgi:hypothetical protein
MTFITTREVAFMADLTPDAVRYHERKGHLLAFKIERSPGIFQRLFLKEDVEKLIRQRAEKHELTAAAKASTA